MMKRPRRQAAGLLDLPSEVLDLILSFLSTVTLASLRLVCRALRDAATKGPRGRVALSSGDLQLIPSMYRAMACASPRVLRQMHTFQASMERLLEDHKRSGTHPPSLQRSTSRPARPDEAAYRGSMKALHMQLLANVAGEVVSLDFWQACLARNREKSEQLHQLRVLLPQMRQLESLFLRLDVSLNSAILQELPALPHLTSLKLAGSCSETDIQAVCGTLALSHLHLGRIEDDDDEFDYRSIPAMLASGKTGGLQELVLTIPEVEMEHLSGLSALTALTALSVHTASSPGDLGGLPSLTGLKSLRVCGHYLDEPLGDVGYYELTLSPLAALTGLTRLDLDGGYPSDKDDYVPPSHVSVLSALMALRVLCCSFFATAEVVSGDPLPVELRFLRTAPALEVLKLGFLGSFWSLPDASIHAVREAVRGLLSVKQISLHIAEEALEPYYLALSAFAAASSIETLSFTAPGQQWDGLENTAAQARDCLSALTKLRSLSLASGRLTGRVPHCAKLLAGLPSTDLTSLSLNVLADEAIEHEIARFRDLQSLSVGLGWGGRPQSLDKLCDLKCLTQLVVRVTPGQCAPPWIPARSRGRVTQESPLETAIREYGRLVGIPVKINMHV